MPNWKKVVVSGSDATLNSLYVAGPITGSDVKINGWGSVSASLASISSGASTLTLQDVTDNGNTTTNNIIVSGSIIKYGTGARNRLDVGASYTTHSGSLYIYHPTLFTNTGLKALSLEGGQLDFRSYQGAFGTASAHQIGLDTVTSNILKFKTGPTAGSTAMTIDGTGHVVIGADATASLATDSLTIVGGDLNLSYNDIRQVGSGSFGYVSSSDAYIDDWGSISASLASIEATVPTLQQVTDNGNTTGNAIIITGSQSNSLTLKTNGIAVSGSVSGPYHGKTHEVIYDTLSVLSGATTTISQLTVPYVAGFTFDYVAFVSTEGGGASAPGLNVGRAGTVKGILRGSSSFSKGFQIAETTTLDLEDQDKGTDGLQFNVVQDSTGNSNQLVAITNSDWSYTINYTLTLYNNPVYS